MRIFIKPRTLSPGHGSLPSAGRRRWPNWHRYGLVSAACLVLAVSAALPAAAASAAVTTPRSPASPSSPHLSPLSGLHRVQVEGAAPDVNYWEINNGAHELCLDAVASGDGTSGDNVQLWKCNGGKNQEWNGEGLDTFYINEAHGLCLDARDPGIGNGDNVQLWKCNNQYNQFWDLTGNWQEFLGANEAYCLDAVGSHDGSNGDNVDIWQCNGGSNQVW